MKAVSATRNQRRRFLVNGPLQWPIIGVLLIVMGILGVASLASIYLTLYAVLHAMDLLADPGVVAIFTKIGVVVTLEMLIVAPFAVLVGVLLTHRVAGPLVRIQAALGQMAKGDYQVQLTLRRGDSLSELAEHVNQLAAVLRQRTE